MEQQNIGKFICAKRKEKNLTQEQLAEKLGVSNKTISKWENGKCMPDYAVVELLCEVLEITIAELLAGKENVVAISALDGRGVPDLVNQLEVLALGGKKLCVLMIPNNKQGLISQLYAASAVEDVEYLDKGVRVVAVLDEKLRGRFKDYIVG